MPVTETSLRNNFTNRLPKSEDSDELVLSRRISSIVPLYLGALRFFWDGMGGLAAHTIPRVSEHLILGGVVTAAPAGEMLKCLPIRAMIQMAFASAEAAIRANVRKTTRERFGPIQVKKPGQWLGEPKHKGIMCDLYLLTGSNSLKQNERISR